MHDKRRDREIQIATHFLFVLPLLNEWIESLLSIFVHSSPLCSAPMKMISEGQTAPCYFPSVSVGLLSDRNKYECVSCWYVELGTVFGLAKKNTVHLAYMEFRQYHFVPSILFDLHCRNTFILHCNCFSVTWVNNEMTIFMCHISVPLKCLTIYYYISSYRSSTVCWKRAYLSYCHYPHSRHCWPMSLWWWMPCRRGSAAPTRWSCCPTILAICSSTCW